MTEYKFTIEGRFFKKNRTLPGLNDFLSEERRSPYAGNQFKKKYQFIICNAIRKKYGRLRIKSPVYISYTYYEADRRRDLDNIAGCAHKFIQDALVQCNVLKDDGWDYVKGFSDNFKVDKNNPRIEVLLIEEV